jgi:mannose-1-phosphate guanylyltransferase
VASRYAVILAGGRGERFWPLSTARRPKQFLSLVGGKPMLVQALDRIRPLIPASHTFIITRRDLVGATAALAPRLKRSQIIGEPAGRDTGAAIAVGAALVKQRDPRGVFCVLTADHVMGDLAVFRRTLDVGLALAAERNALITIGIPPTHPSTGYGYIEAGAASVRRRGIEFRQARRFVEKPDRLTARKYLASGKYFWNSGMFIWSVPAIEAAFKKHRRPLYNLIQSLADAGPATLPRRMARAYRSLEKISIDYAVMEKADNILVARGRFAWDDVGAWTALGGHFTQDGHGNAVAGEVAALASSGNIAVSDRRHLTALIGVRDLVVVQAHRVTLVCHKDHAQDVKKMVELLRARGRHPHLL